MILRQGIQKFETTFVKQNRSLVHKCDFRFLGTLPGHIELSDLSSKIEVWRPRFKKSGVVFGLFPGAPLKSETISVHQLLILFPKIGLRFSGHASEHRAKNSTTPRSLIDVYEQLLVPLIDPHTAAIGSLP